MSDAIFETPNGEETNSIAKAKKALADAIGSVGDAPPPARYDLLHPVLPTIEWTGDGTAAIDDPAKVRFGHDSDLPELAGSQVRETEHDTDSSEHRVRHISDSSLQQPPPEEHSVMHSGGAIPDIRIAPPWSPEVQIHTHSDAAATPPPPVAAAPAAPEQTTLNGPPTGLAIDHDTILESSGGGTLIGSFSATDPNAGEAFQYQIIGGDGRFTIVDGKLLLASGVNLDFETEPTITLNIRVTDRAGNSYQKPVTIHVLDVNETPHDLTLTGSSVAENAPGAVIGTVSALDPDHGDTLTYSVSDSRFEIVSGALKLKSGVSLDHESEPHVTLTLTATDSGGLTTHQTVTINVGDVNEAPYSLTLTGSMSRKMRRAA